jgi:hypothetical protein
VVKGHSIYLESKLINLMKRERLRKMPGRLGSYYFRGTMPERMGSYHWVVNYDRPGFSFVDVRQRVFVRPWQYKEYLKNPIRDMLSLASVLSILTAFLMTASVFLFNSSRKELLIQN